MTRTTSARAGTPDARPALRSSADDLAERVVRAAVDGLRGDVQGRIDPDAVMRSVLAHLHRTLAESDDAELPGHLAAMDNEGVSDDLLREIRGPRFAAALRDAANGAARANAALAASLYGAAVQAGIDPMTVAAARAETHARVGDMSKALQYAEEALEWVEAPRFAQAVGTAATILSHRGLATTAAALYRRSPAADLADPTTAAVSMYVTGARDEAVELLETARNHATPTLVTSGKLMLAEGIELSLHGTRTAALSKLANAGSLLEPAGNSVLLPYTPAAIGASLAMHCGEFATARSILDRAIRTDSGGPAFRVRHRLLRAWVAMLTGQLVTAARMHDEARRCGVDLQLRDEYLSYALQAGIARRNSDAPALLAIWQQAREAVLEFQVDLLSLLPFGELMIAAARLREPSRLDVQREDAIGLLERLGEPPLWSALPRWLLLQAAILSEQPQDLAAHLAALRSSADTSEFYHALAAGGAAWQRVLGDDVDFTATATAARELDAHGLPWDASRLAAQAAARTHDRKVMVDLLQVARLLQPTPESVDTAGGTTQEIESSDPPGARPGQDDEPGLSARELEVARLVLVGQTYREIGERLFISSKTVEHHIARIRKRLGATNRSELFALMQAALERSGAQHDATVRWLNVAPTADHAT